MHKFSIYIGEETMKRFSKNSNANKYKRLEYSAL